MNVRIIGNETTGYRVVNAKTNKVLAAAGSYSVCLLIAGQKGWKEVR
jgi:hypothetical protein